MTDCARCGHDQDAHAGDKDCVCGACMWFVWPRQADLLASLGRPLPGLEPPVPPWSGYHSIVCPGDCDGAPPCDCPCHR